jgi:hypothetical protein
MRPPRDRPIIASHPREKSALAGESSAIDLADGFSPQLKSR